MNDKIAKDLPQHEPDSDALTWRGADGHVHKTEQAERSAVRSERTHKEHATDLPFPAMRTPPD
ncbi:hypothetical protein [Pelagibacterium lacus]|uniref:Uncharacterized protein n=1 Tax=Pelagibacterium lacus TaxID=2282655 RepID=A0A369W6C1_9HYPH|nr:hypothetical protein [Pelagibacterium lacus]RDE09883.1 hypothetical protein DVH29_04950 [Pelagibacterium lacus]